MKSAANIPYEICGRKGQWLIQSQGEGPSTSVVAAATTLGVQSDRSSHLGPTVLFSGETSLASAESDIDVLGPQSNLIPKNQSLDAQVRVRLT